METRDAQVDGVDFGRVFDEELERGRLRGPAIVLRLGRVLCSLVLGLLLGLLARLEGREAVGVVGVVRVLCVDKGEARVALFAQLELLLKQGGVGRLGDKGGRLVDDGFDGRRREDDGALGHGRGRHGADVRWWFEKSV